MKGTALGRNDELLLLYNYSFFFFFLFQVAISEALARMNDGGDIFHQGLKMLLLFCFVFV